RRPLLGLRRRPPPRPHGGPRPRRRRARPLRAAAPLFPRRQGRGVPPRRGHPAAPRPRRGPRRPRRPLGGPGMTSSVRTIADYATSPQPSVAEAVHALRGVGDRGIHYGDQLTPWSEAVQAAATRIAAVRELLASASASAGQSHPPHIGLQLSGPPAYLHLLPAAASSDTLLAGPNPTPTRYAPVADCGLLPTDGEHEPRLEGLALPAPVVSVASPAWAALLARPSGATLPDLADVPVGTDDLVALVFPSGTSGDPKAVRITQ